MSAVASVSRFRVRDPRFEDVLGSAPRLELVAEVDAHEGPVYVAEEDALYFTTVRTTTVAIKRLELDSGDVSVVVADANQANGMALDRNGHLVVCEQGSWKEPARLSRLERATGERETIVDAVDGLPLNSPNDVVVRRDGSIWFTDPSYGYLQGFRPEPAVPDRLYRVEPYTGDVSVAAIGFDKPNGLSFSLDEQILYVADNGAPHHLLAFDVEEDGNLRGRRRVAVGSPEHPDGLKVDTQDRIYASARNGIHVLAPTGELLGEIELPGAVNFSFGGRGGNTLFITTDTAVWAAVVNAKGA
ncbi:MAG TPA: SMP-30/gluconolactonase/LRE family protein [Gaiellaceae bacterium]|nr:SMP-30/gluconolactonase/LRE family protein [Gaiellaceae bacterium]